MPNHSLHSLKIAKKERRRFATITAYDATFARLAEQANIECILVGDSLGNVIQGRRSTVPVSLDDMIYHTKAVTRGCKQPFVMTDMPFLSYGTADQAIQGAAALMQAGAQMVKMEGANWLTETIAFMSARGIPICGHLGLLPQSVNKIGGYRYQGKDDISARRILDDACEYEQAGADILLLECVPAALAETVREAVEIPVIGIGAGPHTDSQVLVLQDMLGISQRIPSFAKNFLASSSSILEAMENYGEAVRNGTFPGSEYSLA